MNDSDEATAQPSCHSTRKILEIEVDTEKTTASRLARMGASALGLALLLGAVVPAQAADHALIMGVGNYRSPNANLPGIDKDVAAARRMALGLGIPSSNIRTLADAQVSSDGVREAFDSLDSTVKAGDRVFIYYSGHGAQVAGSAGGSRCTEGMFVHDMKLYRDTDLERSLQRLASKAAQLVMFNDSCFSGGAATKSTASDGVPKLYKAVADQSNYSCGEAVNTKTAMRNLIASASKAGNNMVYIAAASDDEVAFATREGSSATLAWEACLASAAADTNRSGGLSAEELRQCAQGRVRDMKFNQTITVEGNRNLPVAFAAASNNSRPDAGASSPRRSLATLEDIRQAASSAIQVELRASRQELVINRDPLQFSVRTSKPGYLYVLHVGSDGKTFDLLFPNDNDRNNQVTAGTVQLPRPSWAIMAAGPAGESHLMAIVSDAPRDFSALMRQKMGPFSATEADTDGQRNLIAVSSNTGGAGSSAYGASSVLTIRERN
jgi:metacaspase-1